MSCRRLSVFALAMLFLLVPLVGLAQEAVAVQPATAEAARLGPTDSAELEAFIDGVMHAALKEFTSAGAVVSVVSGGELFFAKGYGFMDWGERTPVDPETTLFRIGSVSKLFVWTSVMQMVEEGLLNLDTDINEYLDIEIPPTFEKPVTLANLMAHAGGFEDYVIKLFGDEPEDLLPLGEILAAQLPERVRPAGDISSYSNHGTAMAAYMVQRASETDWAQYVEEEIFRPLGMEYATFRQPIPEDIAEYMSGGFRHLSGWYEERDFEYVPLYPVGAAAVSGNDMARFMIAHLQLGRYEDQRILSEETARLMHSTHHSMDPGINGMAHGFADQSRHGVRIIGHGGDTRLFHSGLWLFPEHDLGLFVSFNSQTSGGARGRLFGAFMDRYFPAEDPPPTPPEDFAERAQRFTGEYRVNRNSYTTIAKVAAVQTTSVSATDRGTLRALGAQWVEVAPLTFKEENGSGTLVFRENEDGEITHFLTSGAPYLAFERPPRSEHPALHLAIFILAIASIVLTLVAPFLGWAIRRWFRVEARNLVRIPRGARVTLWLAALFFACLFGILPTILSGGIAVAVPAFLNVGFLMPILGGILTLAALVHAGRIWTKGEGRFSVRILYSLSVVSFCLFLWQLNTWNWIGWNY